MVSFTLSCYDCRHRGSEINPKLLVCTECNTKTGYVESIRRCLTAAFNSENLGAVPTTPSELDQFRWCMPLSKDCQTDADWTRYFARASVLQYQSQAHKFNHTESCFKKGNKCRYQCPHIPCDKTGIELGMYVLFIIFLIS
jgi:hypothetical protein